MNRVVGFGTLVFLLAPYTPAGAVSFTKIADRHTTVPDKITRFQDFGDVLVDGTNVAFEGIDLLSGRGLYLYDGTSIEKIVDENTLIPGGFGATFHTFNNFSLDGSNVAFPSGVRSGSLRGIYARIDDEIEVIADSYTRVPDGSRDFASLGSDVSIDGTDVAFTASAFPNGNGIFARIGGVTTTIVDSSVAVPGGSQNFRQFGDLSLENGRVAFVASEKLTNSRGIYLGDGNELTIIADGNTPLSGRFARWSFSMDGHNDGMVIIRGQFENGGSLSGVYQYSDEGISLLFDDTTPLNDGSGPLSQFGHPSFDAGSIVMSGRDSAGNHGIFLYRDGLLQRLIDENDTLDGRQIESVSIGQQAISDDWIPFRVRFNDNTNALYLADLDPMLQPGDANQDLAFDQADVLQVLLQRSKYRTGESATWGEGDWDGAPVVKFGVGNPPPGNGFFDQVDIIKSLQSGLYLTGPYGSIQPNGQAEDQQTSIVYDANTGELSVDSPTGAELTSINVESAAGIFTADTAQNLGGSFDIDSNEGIFKATFGGSFGSLSFGSVAQAGLSEEFLLGDLAVTGSLAAGGALGEVDLIYVPEPSTVTLFLLGMSAVWPIRSWQNHVHSYLR